MSTADRQKKNKHNTGNISAKGKTIQVFLEKESRMLDLNKPEFYEAWEQKMEIEVK